MSHHAAGPQTDRQAPPVNIKYNNKTDALYVKGFIYL
jgi:hypothetical protein